ncbi:MAG: spermidine/putrescine ABC transporter substrate-binding protein, partial [Eubacteriales bacterium]
MKDFAQKAGAFALAALCMLPAMTVPLFAADSGYDIPYSDSVDWDKLAGQNVTLNVYNWGE